jgi:hypothetical protein
MMVRFAFALSPDFARAMLLYVPLLLRFQLPDTLERLLLELCCLGYTRGYSCTVAVHFFGTDSLKGGEVIVSVIIMTIVVNIFFLDSWLA